LYTLYLADLMHDHFTYRTVPYAIACVGSHAKGILGDALSLRLFRSPDELGDAVLDAPPDLMAFSNYAWNATLTYEYARRIKALSPRTVVILGGPHYPTEPDRQHRYLADHPAVDFYVQQEGEIAFSRLLQALLAHDLDAGALKAAGTEIPGCHYVHDQRLVHPAPKDKIRSLDIIPSPYLNGMLDRYLEADDFVPLVETKRGCPFSCTFCVEGLPYYNTLGSAGPDRFEAELDYIARKIARPGTGWRERPVFITDANFGMYKEDLEMCRRIARIQERHGWPRQVDVSTGKNNKQRIIEAAQIANGAFFLAVSLQSTDPNTLKFVKRTNLSTSAIFDAARHNRERGQRSYSELMLGLPGETKEAHLRTVATVMNAGIDRIYDNATVLLPGTEMDTLQSRKDFGLVTKYRILTACFGRYRFGDETFSWGEPVEHVVANAAMPAEDFRYCWRFLLSVEIFYSDNYFEELVGLLHHHGVPVFDFVRRCHDLIEADGDAAALRGLYDDRDVHTVLKLWDTAQDCLDAIRSPEGFDEYSRSGNASSLGNQKARAVLYHTEALHGVARRAALNCLQAIGVQSPALDACVEQLTRYSLLKKCKVTEQDEGLDGSFDYDFVSIEGRGYAVDLAGDRLPSPTRIHFAHDARQAEQIRVIVQENRDPIALMRALVYPNINDPMKTLFRRACVASPAGEAMLDRATGELAAQVGHG
jgi:radical SAM superfamily enzyme YgiQ (UPF0313 family)